MAAKDQTFTLEQVGEHGTTDNLWIVVNGEVLDITKYQHDHPGGDRVFRKVAGADATKQFLKNHKLITLDRFRDEIKIGELAKEGKEEVGWRAKLFKSILKH